MTTSDLTSYLPRSSSAPSVARQLVRSALEECAESDVIETAELLVSELVTNALVHTDAPRISVRLNVAPSLVRIGVRDPSRRRPVRMDEGDPTTPGGFGVGIVETLASEWGVDENPDGKTVWFELETGSGRPSTNGSRPAV